MRINPARPRRSRVAFPSPSANLDDRFFSPASAEAGAGYFPPLAFFLSGIDFGISALGRVSSAPPMSCLFGSLCQATLLGIHSVANIEKSRFGFSAPQLGHGGPAFADAGTSSSNSVSHDVHRYS